MKGLKTILCLLVIATLSQAVIYSKLSSLYSTVLTPADYLTSTLGLFRVTLNPQWCQLKIENFINGDYSILGYYPRSAQAPCQFLTIAHNQLYSNNNDSILSLRQEQLNTVFDEVYVTIDDMGIIRINGVYIKYFHYYENWISIFRTPQQYIYSMSNINVNLYSSLSFIQNAGRWGFSATNGELRIFRIDDVSKITRYNYSGFSITPNNLFDFSSNSIPYADFKSASYQPRCSSGDFLSFQGPFTFLINPYWPELRLIDQKGYEILAIRYPNPNCIKDIGVDYVRDTDQCISWFCPSNTFEFAGSCVVTCPSPYFHQLGRNGINRCLLSCQSGFDRDFQRRICSCGEVNLFDCPFGLKPTPLGCLCTDGTFFNPTNLPDVTKNSTISNYCFKNCGNYFFGMKDGLCVPCPKYCITCQLSGLSFNFLTCTSCQQGFTVSDQGYCIKRCDNIANTSQSSFQNTSKIFCPRCLVSNCLNCDNGVNKCASCYKPYSLFDNNCLTQCPRGYKSLFNETLGFFCVAVPQCGEKPIIFNSMNNQSSCYCTKNGNAGFLKGCGKDENSCQFEEYYEPNLGECLACPPGCLTCVVDFNNRVECTSCRPAYRLLANLPRNNYCERNSLLTICPNLFNKTTQICNMENINDFLIINTNRNLCKQSIKKCMFCLTSSIKFCSMCEVGYYLYKGECYETCPNQTNPYRYQRVCIPMTIKNCLVEKTQSSFWLFMKNNFNQYSDAYYYMIAVNFQALDPRNDPIGALFMFSQRSSTIEDRMVNIATSYQKCLVCSSGFGLTSTGICKKCKDPCLQCTFVIQNSSNGSCLKCDPFHRLSPQRNCQKLNLTQTPCIYGQYRNQSYICQKDCLGFYFINYNSYKMNANTSSNFTINCTLNCPSGYFILDYLDQKNQTRLKCQIQRKLKQNQNRDSPSISFLGNKVSFGVGKVYFLISSTELMYKTDNPYTLEIANQDKSRRLLEEGKRSLTAYKTSYGLIIVDKSDTIADSSLIVQLQATNLYSTFKDRSTYIGNSIYGFNSNSPSFMDLIYNQTSNLYMYGRAYIFLLLILTIIFLSQQVNYKTDNLFITFSVIYLILPSLNLKPDTSAMNSYSFLYGFAWSAHLQLFSNPRFVTKNMGWFNDLYLQKVHTNAHYLLFIDNNLIRNGWSIFLVMICSIALFGLILIFLRCFSVKKKGFTSVHPRNNWFRELQYQWSSVGYQQQDFNHIQSVLFLLLFFIENSFIGLSYYSFIALFNSSWQLAPAYKTLTYKILGGIFILLMVAYNLIKWYVNRIGGLYCSKRIALGICLGTVSCLGGVNDNLPACLLLLLVVEVTFTLLRFKFQLKSSSLTHIFKKQVRLPQNETRVQRRQTSYQRPNRLSTSEHDSKSRNTFTKEQFSEVSSFRYILVEEILIIILYVFLSMVNFLQQVSVLIIWIIINIFMIIFGVEFFDLAINYWHIAYNKMPQNPKSYIRKIRTMWDHDVESFKSLAETTETDIY